MAARGCQPLTLVDFKIVQLNFTDFLEALCLVANLKAIPTARDVSAARCKDGGELLLRLAAEPAQQAQFHEDYKKNMRFNTRPLQTTASALEQLITFVVRTITLNPNEELVEPSTERLLSCLKKGVKQVHGRRLSAVDFRAQVALIENTTFAVEEMARMVQESAATHMSALMRQGSQRLIEAQGNSGDDATSSCGEDEDEDARQHLSLDERL